MDGLVLEKQSDGGRYYVFWALFTTSVLKVANLNCFGFQVFAIF